MLFNSVGFLLFFPAVCLVYFAVPQRFKYLWLLIASYYFYMCWNAKYALLLTVSILITYASGLLIQQVGKNIFLRKLWVGLSFGSNLAILFFFKYFSFAAQSIYDIFTRFGIQLNLPAFDVLLPVGISFYTFQALSYTMDVYRKEIEPERNILKYALFVSFFPQLVAGPIERSKNLLHQVNEKHFFDYERMKDGLLLMLWGFFEKMVIADQAAIVVNKAYEGYANFNGIQILFATVLFAIQIYCDFGGYSHIAIGAARVMGFELMDNFRQPYFATSVQDFWRRWHISLSTWFRDYLYIPLGGNRKGKTRKYVNLMITFLASGLWHGANWTYVVWGGLNGVFQVIGEVTHSFRNSFYKKIGVQQTGSLVKFGKRMVTFGLICFTWIFFRAESISQVGGLIKQMLTHPGISDFKFQNFFLYGNYEPSVRWMIMMGAAILVLLLVDLYHEKKGKTVRSKILKSKWWVQSVVAITAICIILTFGVYGEAYDAAQFIYFQF